MAPMLRAGAVDVCPRVPVVDLVPTLYAQQRRTIRDLMRTKTWR
jgi:hypothetical protein